MAIAKTVQADIDALKIDTMEVSEENKQKLKKTRTKLNKDLAMYEGERKKIKAFVLKPYTSFEESYSTNLKVIITGAVTKLNTKIKTIETGQIKEFEDYGKEYFLRKLESNPISVANTFKDVGLSMSLSLNKKKIREAIDKHIESISSALTIIEGHEHSARLKVLWETEADYDIGVALTKLTLKLNLENAAKPVKKAFVVPEVHLTEINPYVEPEIINIPVEPEEVYDFGLKITVTENQLASLTTFMEENDIIFALDE